MNGFLSCFKLSSGSGGRGQFQCPFCRSCSLHPAWIYLLGTHLGAGFPLASHSIKMLSRGSTMWSFTDCLVMVGGWDTARTHTVSSQGCGDLPLGNGRN